MKNIISVMVCVWLSIFSTLSFAGKMDHLEREQVQCASDKALLDFHSSLDEYELCRMSYPVSDARFGCRCVLKNVPDNIKYLSARKQEEIIKDCKVSQLQYDSCIQADACRTFIQSTKKLAECQNHQCKQKYQEKLLALPRINEELCSHKYACRDKVKRYSCQLFDHCKQLMRNYRDKKFND